MSAPPPSGGFSLFPNTSTRPPSRTQVMRPRGTSPQPASQEATSPSERQSPSRNGRQTPLQQQQSVAAGKQPASNGRQSAMDGRSSAMDNRAEPIIERPAPVAEVPQRCETALSDARTLVRSNSERSRSSIAKPPLVFTSGQERTGDPSSPEQPGLRSIFPQYNPELPPDRQDYYPTHTSPTHIPRGAISRPLYSPTPTEARSPAVRSPVRSPPMRSPMSAGSTTRWAPRVQEAPIVPEPSTLDETRNLWKVTNGWKAGGSEGRVYCLKMTNEKDAPVYTLSSGTQPFYNLRLDPTSASAYVSLSRHDPNKPYKGTAGDSSPGSNKSDTKNWQEVLNTTLEEESRRHQPNDGLVALLYPSAAAKVALERAGDAHAVAAAERECARLVWDVDSGNHYLVHAALAVPFCVTIERNPAWSRTEYTLEHLESPQHLARLTRDGTGAGWLEVDTAIAAKIDAVYLVDVAVAALLVVAHGDDQFARVEFFEPPPTVRGSVGTLGSSRAEGARSSRASRREEKKEQKRLAAAKNKKNKPSRMEEFEMDIESQTSELNKIDVRDKEKLPGTARGVIKLLTVLFKCFIWVATLGFKALTAIIAGLAKCLTSDKL